MSATAHTLLPIPVAPAALRRDLCVVIHDVAPARWDACRRLLAQLRVLAEQAGQPLPLTLLVVPLMHGDAACPVPYLQWLHEQQQAGHELVLHGLTHHDDGPPPRGLAEALLRRVYTAGEGEFSALPQGQAAYRLDWARAWAAERGLSSSGFVAPAWLLNDAAEQAVRQAGFTHLATPDRIVSLPDGGALHALALGYSNRSRWRRVASVVWNQLLYWQQQAEATPLLRLELHPGDGDDATLARCWQRLLMSALRERRPIRLIEAAALARERGRVAQAGRHLA